MERGLKRLPVVNAEGQLVGMLSRLDVLRTVAGNGAGQQEQAPAPQPGRTVVELMSANVPVVHVNTYLPDILDQMLKADIKRIVVLDEQERAATFGGLPLL